MTKRQINKRMRLGLLRIAFFTGRKEKCPPDTRDEGCTCVRMQVEHNVPEYAAKFLLPQKCNPGTTCRIKCSTMEKMTMIIRLIGGNGMSVKAYVNNILDNHLEQYRDEINELIETTKKFKL